MVFANLSYTEKQAFFGLLDEYFASRPEVVQALNTNSTSSSNPSQAQSSSNALHNVLSNAAAHIEPAWKRQNAAATAHGTSSAQQSPELPASVGRVAAAAASFKFGGGAQPPPTAPRPPPRRISSYGQESDESPAEQHETPPQARMPSQFDKLASQKKFGDVDLSSAKNAYLSIRHGTANKQATPPPAAPPVSSAIPPKRSQYAPPPVRRVTSTSKNENTVKTASPPPPPPPRPRVEEPEEEGDWAEVLYDYASEDPGDLEVQAGQRILIVERTSDDWWTGELQGNRGLVPAAYVKML